MRISQDSTFVQGAFALAIPIVAAAWLVTVPTVVSASSFLAVLGIVTAFAWVAKRTYGNAQPPTSLAQQLHDVDHVSSASDQWRNR
jgi:hypothetical protein